MQAPFSSSDYMQDDASKQRLLLQVLTEEEHLECFLRERSRSLDTRVHQAALWLPGDAQTDKQGQPEQHPQAIDTLPHDSTLQSAAGFVRVCGIDLPCRTGASQASTGQPSRLIHTAAVADNMKAAALALCQSRPLLLEGPPGQVVLLSNSWYTCTHVR